MEQAKQHMEHANAHLKKHLAHTTAMVKKAIGDAADHLTAKEKKKLFAIADKIKDAAGLGKLKGTYYRIMLNFSEVLNISTYMPSSWRHSSVARSVHPRLVGS